MGTPDDMSLSCDNALDALVLQADLSSAFYILVTGWYLGQWADYSSCLGDAANSQYVLASVKGNYEGQITFTRGGIGKFSDGFSTRMGICFPKQCSLQEIQNRFDDTIKSYAVGIGWTNVEVSYHDASKFADEKST